jgi:hypothetical protein
MDEGNRLVVRGRCGVMDEIAVQARPDEAVPDGAQPVGTFRVVGPHFVPETRRVGNVGGRHDVCFMCCTAKAAEVVAVECRTAPALRRAECSPRQPEMTSLRLHGNVPGNGTLSQKTTP